MKLSITILFFVCFLAGCIPPSAMLKTQSLQEVEAGFVADSDSGKLFLSNEDVDIAAEEITQVLREFDFERTNQSVSFGLLPATGHTQNLGFKLGENIYVQAYVEISKSSVKVVFREMELEHGKNNFLTDEKERQSVKSATAAVTQYLKSKIGTRSIRVLTYENPPKP
ncbi:hypothetical protein [Teredinibacter purpureus]|uniref:hypothetical protein n=1 Tax=Teredinibacter purpureus TaxID=2731756 RepID=UPI0005F7D99E|nr:hypothetical protein [Teredinibacter purpureus]